MTQMRWIALTKMRTIAWSVFSIMKMPVANPSSLLSKSQVRNIKRFAGVSFFKMSIIAGYGCFKYVIRFFVKNVFIVTPPPMVYCGKLASSLMLVCDCEYTCNYLPAPLCTCCTCMKESNLIPFPSQSIDSSLLLIANLMSFNIMGYKYESVAFFYQM